MNCLKENIILNALIQCFVVWISTRMGLLFVWTISKLQNQYIWNQKRMKQATHIIWHMWVSTTRILSFHQFSLHTQLYISVCCFTVALSLCILQQLCNLTNTFNLQCQHCQISCHSRPLPTEQFKPNHAVHERNEQTHILQDYSAHHEWL